LSATSFLRNSRSFLSEVVSGLTILGIGVLVFVHSHQWPAGSAQDSGANSLAHLASAPAHIHWPVREISTATDAGLASHSHQPDAAAIAPCDRPGGMGLERIVEIDTTSGPAFGLQRLRGYDFLRDKEVVLTFDDGPWPGSTAAVLKALEDQCLRATFFEIGEHAAWHPEITRQVLAAGMVVGTHTWSHKDLARNPYAREPEKAEQEIEMGNSAVYAAAAGAPVAPFFRFPNLQHPPALLEYLAHRNIATFSTDIDSRDFTMHRPEQVVASVMTQLAQRHKGIVLLHDLHQNTADALPTLLRRLKDEGYKVVQILPKGQLTTIAKYDEMFKERDKLSSNAGGPAQ
jgi:peptidoglycan-N-acetylglucosamine deacetylase